MLTREKRNVLFAAYNFIGDSTINQNSPRVKHLKIQNPLTAYAVVKPRGSYTVIYTHKSKYHKSHNKIISHNKACSKFLTSHRTPYACRSVITCSKAHGANTIYHIFFALRTCKHCNRQLTLYTLHITCHTLHALKHAPITAQTEL